ncbi:MAG: lytic transglycosylase domain-containing protein [Acidiferrobacterales bacterium]
MGNAFRRLFNQLRLTISFLLVYVVSASAHAAVYVYQAKDGSWMFSDQPLKSRQYKLVRKATQARGAAVPARQSKADFRGDPAAYDRLIRRMARAYNVDPALIKAVMHAESAFNPYATSHKGASGLMQLMPATAARYGVHDIYDPVQNVRAAVQYLKDLMARFGNEISLAVAAYNAGENAVEQHKGVPPYKETRTYVRRVMHFKRRYSRKF